ncbi:hypothetical protein OQA88_9901 [Cercophora sp. LCS_1]
MVPIQCEDGTLNATENAVDFLCRALHDKMFLAGGDTQDPKNWPAAFCLVDSQTTKTQAILPKHIWIDAICINQTDLAERSQQVSIMGDIYQQCVMTLVWLGKEDPGPEASWVMKEFAPRFLEAYSVHGYHHFLDKSPDCTDPTLVQAFGEDICVRWRQDFAYFFLFLLQRRWFTRGWTVQEVVLKAFSNLHDAVVMCGPLTILWQDLLKFVTVMTDLGWSRSLTPEITSHSAFAYRPEDLTILIQSFETVGALYHYALDYSRGEGMRAALRERYGLLTGLAQTYTTFMDLLHQMRSRHFTDHRGPSLSKDTPESTSLEWFLAKIPLLKAQSGPYKDPHEAVSRTLVANVFPSGLQESEYALTFREWWKTQLSGHINSLLDEQLPHFLNTLEAINSTGDWFPKSSNDLHQDPDPQPESSPLDLVTARLWPCRRAFLTSDMRLGLGHDSVEVGDEIWLLEGGRTPFILRKSSPSTRSYRIIGEAYIHEIMYGELATPECLNQMGPVTLE